MVTYFFITLMGIICIYSDGGMYIIFTGPHEDRRTIWLFLKWLCFHGKSVKECLKKWYIDHDCRWCRKDTCVLTKSASIFVRFLHNPFPKHAILSILVCPCNKSDCPFPFRFPKLIIVLYLVRVFFWTNYWFDTVELE